MLKLQPITGQQMHAISASGVATECGRDVAGLRVTGLEEIVFADVDPAVKCDVCESILDAGV